MKIMALLPALGLLAGPAYAGSHPKASDNKTDWIAAAVAQTKTHGWAGLEYEKVKDEQGNLKKLKVKAVTPDSPAAAAGFAVGDVIMAINGHPVAEMKAFKKDLVVGKAATYSVARKKGEEWAKSEFKLTLIEPPREVLAQWLGYQLLAELEQREEAKTAVAQAGK
jgi:membrane-associated protease RseP (regulator of RpoE activity)